MALAKAAGTRAAEEAWTCTTEEGGGGYGRPQDRERERIEEDLREGYITQEGARRDYGVELD